MARADTRVLFLVSGSAGPSIRFRVEQWRPHLAALGIRSDVGDLDVPLARRVALLRSASGYHRVMVHRVFLSPPELLLLRWSAGGYVFDFDDALMFRDSSRTPQTSWQRRRRLARMLRAADGVIAGNRYLADWAARCNLRVRVVPTSIDLDRFPDHPEPSPEPVVGWIGTRPNLTYLEKILPALARLHGARVKVVCDAFPESPACPIERKPWSLAEEVADLRSFRVGVMPLTDDPWTRGKCAVKILQCFAAFVPVVCSPVGVNPEVVRPGYNGYFATTTEQWVDRIEQLLRDEKTRRRMGAAARETVEERYSVRVTLPALLGALGLGNGTHQEPVEVAP